MASISAFPNNCVSFSMVCGLSFNWVMMAIPIGNIITDVAVLLIHMLKNAVATIKPKMIFLISEPIKLMIFNAIRLCKFHFSIAMAMINPPMYKNTYLCPKALVVVFRSIPLVSGNSTMGNNAVTAMGVACVMHHT